MGTPRPYVLRRGSGVPLLFVHGNGVDHRMMLDLDDAFGDGWERIYLDLPGFGGTVALDAPGGLPELADWLDRMAAELIGSAPFAVVGTSLGALLARELAARRPQRCLGMALLAPVVDSVPENRTLPEPVVLVTDPVLLSSLPEPDALAYAELAVVQSPENWERYRDVVSPGQKVADEAAMERLWQRYALPSSPDEGPVGYHRPVLLVTGRQDAVVGFAGQWRLGQHFPHASYALLDRAGHNIQVDQPQLVRQLLRSWAADVLESR